MASRTFAFASLVLALVSPALLADDEEKSQQSEARPIRPEAEDLERFQLPRSEVPFEMDDPGSSSSLFRISGVGMFAASAADIATTEMGLTRGLREANPAASDRVARIAVHVAGPAAVWWTTERLRNSGRTKLAVTLRIALMAVYGYAAVHNTRLMGRYQGSR